MGLRVIGAGLGRTGTLSLKLALEQLLGEPCYHMLEARDRPDHLDAWRRAALGEPPDWDDLFDGYAAVVDWPAAGFWDQLAESHPEAVILLSTRTDAATWFRSASSTIFESSRQSSNPGRQAMWREVRRLTFDEPYDEEANAIAGYERHNAHVRATAPPDRLVEYQPGDGWAPLCSALGLDVPDEPFPHANTTTQFRDRMELDG